MQELSHREYQSITGGCHGDRVGGREGRVGVVGVEKKVLLDDGERQFVRWDCGSEGMSQFGMGRVELQEVGLQLEGRGVSEGEADVGSAWSQDCRVYLV